ncbi:hypothetical protein PO909_013997 [Leuciscus waleckii]
MPEPSADEEPKPDAMATPGWTPELIIAVEYEPHREADQVCEPATLSMPVGVLVKFVGMEWSPAYTPEAEGELHMASRNFYKEVQEDISLSLPSPPSSKVSCVSTGLAQLQVSCVSKDPTQPPSYTSSTKDSQSFKPASPVSLQTLGSPFVDSTLLHGSDLSLPGSSSALACRPIDITLAPPSLGSTWDHHPPAMPWSVTTLPAPRPSTPLATPQFPGTLAPPWTLIAAAPPLPPDSVSFGLIVSSTPPESPPPSALSKSVVLPGLLPPSTPLWSFVLAVLWFPTWLLLLSSPPWLLPPTLPPRSLPPSSPPVSCPSQATITPCVFKPCGSA